MNKPTRDFILAGGGQLGRDVLGREAAVAEGGESIAESQTQNIAEAVHAAAVKHVRWPW